MHKTKRYNQVVYTSLPSILGDPITDHDIFSDDTRFHISGSINRLDPQTVELVVDYKLMVAVILI